jgi:predicted phage terminase large subunit-like protein
LIHNCAILDDPVSGWEQAQSVTQLQKIHEWFKSDLKSRLKPRAKIITVCQRTAAYDMAGYIMKEFADNPTRRLRTVILPMVCEDPENDPMGRALGERLWPEWYTDEMVADLRKDEFTWKTMWMQQPPSDSGSWVTTEEIQYRPSPPVTKDSSIYGMTDLALSVNTGDYTTHFLVAVDAEGAWDIIHGERERCDPDTSANKVVSLCSAYQPREWLIDDDNMAKVFMPLLATRARSTSTNVPIKMMPMRGQDKETRAAPLRGQFKRRRIYMDPKAPFVPWLVKELLSFPNAVGEGVDDGVDALGLMGRRLMAVSKATNVVEFKRNPTTAEMTLDQLWEDQPNPATARF